MAIAWHIYFERIFSGFKSGKKVACFHCDESMRQQHALMARFDGKFYPVCCHGCVAVLKAVEQNALIAEYWQTKIQNSDANSFSEAG